MTYPDTSIAHPTDIARQADAPWHPGDVQFNLRGLIDTSILIRPLSRHVYASRWTHDGKATAIVADIAVLEDQNHAASLHSQVTVSQPNVVKTLCAVLDSPQVFTVAGVVSTIGDGERRALVLSPLPEALVPAAASEAAVRNWDYPPDYDAIVGRKIAALRSDKGLPQAALAGVLGVMQSGVSDIESGRRSLDLKKLYAIASALSVPVHELLP
ncbi:helix-turn-helix domain-containing protein [Mycobacteroides abscessus]|uniref:helix-turn-helix domain-containing protein n=1 Tax=Mycobacteroides abscessus TaxID=36809 RepID=UPI000926FABD|nr:helix-turn-helix transcriptional regulator [Mycobacteroides abscessus]MBN7332929.1 helix-turn-helix transcriptional regulator [Mycobacteroides abscessus subsp. abscessus]SHP43527.1 XRE family transcriptional regulator [Mycobacteroides abscessus subsp. abscessus]SIE77432.1 XRE family transcriptional regulator [Mycobacteroides abscessus subsp. abscessus]SIF53751.1 XRE family transcriptional regulator [Mycobacteroides abscessus subsp. abscessus]SIG68223.1 XRE family transcriptional regulator [